MAKSKRRKSARYVYQFGTARTEGDATRRELLGGKGANLAEMARLKLPVPAGFTISTEVCTWYYDHDGDYPPELQGQIDAALAAVEETMGARFGDPSNPLLLSVRSGARASMPGMMETVLNLGTERPPRGRPHRAHRRRPLRLRRVPPFRTDVRRRGDGTAPRGPGGDRSLRGAPGEEEGGPGRRAGQPALRRRPGGAGGRVQGPDQTPPEARLPGGSRRAAPGRHRRRLRLLERRPGDHATASWKASPTSGAPRSTCSPWSTATWATTAPPAWPSPAIRPPGRRPSTGSS